MDLPSRAARVGVVFGTALLLTFCRGVMLILSTEPTPLDKALNYFVLTIAPVCALYSLSQYGDWNFVKLIWPVGPLVIWVSWCLFFFTPEQYWPPHTVIISMLLAIFVASQISPAELRLLRYSILFLAGLFSLVILAWAPGLLNEALSGSGHERLGINDSPANVIFMPRVYYTLVFACFATVLIEKRPWLRLLAVALMVVPAVMGLSSGSRGPLLALVVAMLVFALGLVRRSRWIGILVFTSAFALFSFKAVENLFPTIGQRAMGDDTERISFYGGTLDRVTQSVSLIGQGKGDIYAHNIFLEFLQDYGVVGLVLFLVFLAISLKTIWGVYHSTRDVEVLWAVGIVLLQLVAQQFSMDIYVGPLWAALVLPIGVGWWHGKSRPGLPLLQPRNTVAAAPSTRRNEPLRPEVSCPRPEASNT